MITIKEKVTPLEEFYNSYYRITFICPLCDMEYPILSAVHFCSGCYKSIVDVKLLLDSETYALKYHFGQVKESGIGNW